MTYIYIYIYIQSARLQLCGDAVIFAKNTRFHLQLFAQLQMIAIANEHASKVVPGVLCGCVGSAREVLKKAARVHTRQDYQQYWKTKNKQNLLMFI